MSRTIRRKGYEATRNNSWENEAFKVAGHYTQSITSYDDETDGLYGVRCYVSYNEVTIGYRAPATKRERFDVWWQMHGESKHANAWSPGWSYRNYRLREWRQRNRQEVIRWMKNEEYEPMCESDPRNCWWDWS